MPPYKCNRDCHGINAQGQPQLYIKGEKYEIDPTHPCAIHFDLPKTYRAQALDAERKRREKTKDIQAKRAALKASGRLMSDIMGEEIAQETPEQVAS